MKEPEYGAPSMTSAFEVVYCCPLAVNEVPPKSASKRRFGDAQDRQHFLDSLAELSTALGTRRSSIDVHRHEPVLEV